jgi:hypothetical protein
MKYLKILVGAFAMIFFLSACSGDSASVDYEIFDERLDESNQQHLRVETEVTDNDSLMEIIKDINNSGEYDDADSVYMHIVMKGDKNHDGDDELEEPIMRARFANTEKGLTQTGLEELGTVHTEYLYEK